MGYFKQYKGLPREIYFIFVARIVNSLGSFIYPFMTMYLSRKIGMSDETIGVYMTVMAVVGIPGVILGGKLADKFSRKWVYAIPQLAAVVLFGTVGFIQNHPAVPWLMMTASFFMSFVWPALSAMLMDYTTSENRQAAFSLSYLGMNVGFAFGPSIAGLLFENATSWIFWGDALTTLIAVVMVIVVFKDKPADERIATEDLSEHEAAFDGSTFKALLKRPALIAFSLLSALLAWVYAQGSYALPLHMIDIFKDAGARLFGFMGSLNGFEVVILTPIILLLTKNLKPVINMVLVALLYAVGFGLYGVTENIWLFYLATFVWTLGEIIGAVNIGVYIANHSPVTHRGRFQSIFDLIHGSGRATGPILAGMFLAGHSLNQLWYLAALISMIAAVLLGILYRIESVYGKRKAEKTAAGA